MPSFSRGSLAISHLALSSAEYMGTDSKEKTLATVDFPAPIPPVIPTNKGWCLFIFQLKCFGNEGNRIYICRHNIQPDINRTVFRISVVIIQYGLQLQPL